MNVIELEHETDPRYLRVAELPECVTVEDLAEWRYGKPLIICPDGPVTVYRQSDGSDTWVRKAVDRAGQARADGTP